MENLSAASMPMPMNEEAVLKLYLDNYDENEDGDQLVLFRDKDGKVHMISKKINKFEGFWAKLGASKKVLHGFGITIDANFKHVLHHLNAKKISDPRLKRIVERYNRRRKFGKIHMKDFPNLFPHD